MSMNYQQFKNFLFYRFVKISIYDKKIQCTSKFSVCKQNTLYFVDGGKATSGGGKANKIKSKKTLRNRKP